MSDDSGAADAGKKPDGKKTYSEEAFLEVVAQRDEAKKRLRQIDEDAKKLADQKAIEDGKAKEIIEKLTGRLTEVETKAKAYEEQQAKLREGLLSKLTADEDKIAGKYIPDLSELQTFVEKKTQSTGQPDPSKREKKTDKLDLKALSPTGNFSEVAEKLRKMGIGV